MSKIRILGKNEKEEEKETSIYCDKFNKKIAFKLDVDSFFEMTYAYLYSAMKNEVDIWEFVPKYLKQMIIITYNGLNGAEQYLVNVLGKNAKSIKEIEKKLNALEDSLEYLLFILSKDNMLTDVYDLIDSINQNKS